MPRLLQRALGICFIASSLSAPVNANVFSSLVDKAVNAGIEHAAGLISGKESSSTRSSLDFPSRCEQHYVDAKAPVILNPKLATAARHLCADAFATLHSGVARVPLYSAQYLTPGHIRAAQEVGRSDSSFFEDGRLRPSERASLEHYKGSGFDRGHLAPSADMPTPAADAQSFVLSNIVPQDPGNNRTVWAAVEAGVRAMARHRPIYVITGVLWLEPKITRIGGEAGVMVPSHLYKVVFDPSAHKGKGGAAAYLIENRSDRRERQIAVQELEAIARIQFFPERSVVGRITLPKPRYR